MNIDPQKILIENFTYSLPNDRIAHRPLLQRDASKLLVYKSGKIGDDRFANLPDLLPPNSLLVLNDTKVIAARLHFKKTSGGLIEIFCLSPYGQSMETALRQTGAVEWTCLIGGASKWKTGQVLEKEIHTDEGPAVLRAVYKAKAEDGFVIEFAWQPEHLHFADVLHRAGAVPLPPYIKRSAEAADADRYQTVFGKHEGSVAAPTAALHFTDAVFDRLTQKGIATKFVTLNVGAGTFKPVKTASIADHHMHGEDFTVNKTTLENLLSAETVVAVGTTSLRTLESLYWLGVKKATDGASNDWTLKQWEVYDLPTGVDYKESLQTLLDMMNEEGLAQLHCHTSLLIVPGYRFRIPSGLVTNFHQPQSTLLLLIAAFVGDDWRRIYQHAMDNDYRFLSYGDSSLLWRNG